MDLGTFGIYTFDFEHLPATRIRDSVQQLEDMGWRTLWIPEALGRDAFTHAGLLLSAGRRLTVVNGIARIWSREARWTHGAALLLADAYPGRHVLGLGFGGDPRPGGKPLAAMSAYLDELDTLERRTRSRGPRSGGCWPPTGRRCSSSPATAPRAPTPTT
ncbi:LLM class flavin-dependent oxidoreductase [Streptomyces flaveolus]|uniref:LLM class flavin-dependent oxidoreductase n=1 Tax=Streptomyces flaveolus TaxID=67297 RepID=UPI00341BD381